MTTKFDLFLEVLEAEADLHDAQRTIDQARMTFIGHLPGVRSALNRRQARVDAHRFKVEAAKKYLHM